MEEGVAYMMMGDGEGMEQATQLVALQSEDGTQQLAVPVIDPHTGQETYMILDQNSLQGEDGQLLIVGEGEAATLVEGVEEGGYTLANDQNGGMIVLPTGVSSGNTGTNSVVTTSSGPLVQVQLPQEFQHEYVSSQDQALDEKSLVHPPQKQPAETTVSSYSTNSTTVNVPVRYTTITTNASPSPQLVTSSVNTNSGIGMPARGENNSFISVPARNSTVQEAREQQHKRLNSKTIVPGENSPSLVINRRIPRKQDLSEFSAEQNNTDNKVFVSRGPPPGLTGDPMQDSLIVDKLVNRILNEYELNTKEREELRQRIYSNGIGEGKKYLSKYSLKRADDLGLRKQKRPKKQRFIKCDQCDTRFPADTEEAKLYQHVVNFHMTEAKPKPVIAAAAATTPSSKPQHPPPKPVSPKVDRGSPVKSYIDPDQADNIGPQLYRCSDCTEGFLTIKSLLDHQKSKHKTSSPKQVTSASTAAKSSSKTESQQENLSTISKSKLEERLLEDTATEVNNAQNETIPETPSSPSKHKMEVIQKLADEWDDEEDGMEETLNEGIPKLNQSNECIAAARCPSRSDSVKSETLEDISKAVADIKADAAKGKLNTASTTNNAATKQNIATTNQKGNAKESEDEEKIVADVDDILSDTDALIANVSTAVVNTSQQIKKKPGRPRASAPPPALRPLPPSSEKCEEPQTKKRATHQCEECFELFEDKEILAWHLLQNHD